MVQALVIGVDIGHHSIKAVVLKPAGDNYTLLGYQEITVCDDIFTDNHTLDYQKIVKKLKELKKGLPRFSRKVAVTIPDTTVISKVLQIDSELNEHEKEFAIQQAFTHQLPYSREELCFDFVSISGAVNNDSMLSHRDVEAFQVYATKRDVIDSRSLAFEKAGFLPVLADVHSHSLVHLWQRLSQTYQRYDWMLVDIGQTQISLCMDLINQPPFYKSMAMGVEGFTDCKANNVYDDAQPSSEQLSDLSDNITRQINRFVSVNGANSVNGVWLCGGGANREHLMNALAEKCDVMCGVVDPFSLFIDKVANRHRSQQYSTNFATATGIALLGLKWLEAKHVA